MLVPPKFEAWARDRSSWAYDFLDSRWEGAQIFTRATADDVRGPTLLNPKEEGPDGAQSPFSPLGRLFWGRLLRSFQGSIFSPAASILALLSLSLAC